MHLKVFMKLEKNLKTLSSGQKNPKKPQKTKKQKKTTGLRFFKNTRVFSNPDELGLNCESIQLRPQRPMARVLERIGVLLSLAGAGGGGGGAECVICTVMESL
jgi:hypothetical protein